MSLLNEAMAAERRPKIAEVTTEQMELAIAWAEGSVTIGACAKVLNVKSTGALQLMGRYICAAVRSGYLKRTNKSVQTEQISRPSLGVSSIQNP